MNLPVPIILDHKGKSYRLAPLGLADLLEHAKWLRDDHLAEAKRQMVGLPIDLAKHAWTEARAEADKIRIGNREYSQVALGFAGLVHAFWLSARKDDHSLLITTVFEIFSDKMTEAMEAGRDILGFKPVDPIQPE